MAISVVVSATRQAAIQTLAVESFATLIESSLSSQQWQRSSRYAKNLAEHLQVSERLLNNVHLTIKSTVSSGPSTPFNTHSSCPLFPERTHNGSQCRVLETLGVRIMGLVTCWWLVRSFRSTCGRRLFALH